MLHYQEESLWCLYYLIQLYYVGMADDLQNVNFSSNSLNIVSILDLPFV